MQFQITRSGKNKKYNKVSAVELACMQFNAKKKKKKKKKKNTDSDQTLFSVSSAELAQKVVKVKFGKIQIHSNEVVCGRDFTIVRLPIWFKHILLSKYYITLYIVAHKK